MLKIALDAMGSDNAPAPEVEGAILALKELSDAEVVLVGKRDVIEKELSKHDSKGLNLTIEHAEEVVTMSDSPSKALKSKPNSSINKTIELQKSKKAQASISAGNTGAFMAASLFGLGRIKGVSRPAIGVIVPNVETYTFMLDMGANSDCKPQHLFQFAKMGEIYVKKVWGIDNPRIGLLSVGSESSKGSEATVATHAMLRESMMNFIGNIEGNEIVFDKSDVIVCDGFVGNIILKFYESIPKFIYKTVEGFFNDEKSKHFVEKFNADAYGGSELLGVDGVVIISHGKSNSIAIKNAILKSKKMVNTKINDKIKQEIEKDPQCFN